MKIVMAVQREIESLKATLSADKGHTQLQKLQQLNSQLRLDCDKAKKVCCCCCCYLHPT